MTDGLLYKKDTDFVRDNMLINYCLGDDESLLIESFVRNNGICLRFDVGQFLLFHDRHAQKIRHRVYAHDVQRGRGQRAGHL